MFDPKWYAAALSARPPEFVGPYPHTPEGRADAQGAREALQHWRPGLTWGLVRMSKPVPEAKTLKEALAKENAA